jgi:hypothetical protein
MLSTYCSRWSNGPAGCEHKHMVDKRPPMPKPSQRLDHARKMTRCENKAAFAKWIGAPAPQNVENWAKRKGGIPVKWAQKIQQETGASFQWLLTDEGEPFPNGPKIYSGAGPELIEQRLVDLEDQVDVASHVVWRLIEMISAKIPGAGAELEAAFRKLQSTDAAKSQALEVAILAAQKGRESKAAEGRGASRSESGGKPPRSGR